MIAGLMVLLILIPFSFSYQVESTSFENISVSLIKSGESFWTPRYTQEIFNFTISNYNSSYYFNKINITLPSYFSFSNIGSSGNWSCANISFVIMCNNSIPLGIGDVNIWFNASVNSQIETNVTWNVDVINGTTRKRLNLTTGVDGKPPQINNINIIYENSNLTNNSVITRRLPIEINLSMVDNGSGPISSIVYLTKTNQTSYINLQKNNSFYIGSIDTSNLTYGYYLIQIFAYDSVGNLNNSLSRYFYIKDPDFEVKNIWIYPKNPKREENFTVFANLTNTGDVNYSGNISLFWIMGSENFPQEIQNLSVNETKTISYNFTGFSGELNITLLVDPYNLIIEKSEDNNNLTKTVSTDLNVSILDMIYNNISYNLPIVEHNKTITLNVSVKYWNDGSPVSGLSIYNFTIFDNSTQVSFVLNNFSLNSSGIYLIDIITPDINNQKLQYGYHSLKVIASSNNYTGTSMESFYFMDGPNLEIIFSGINDFNVNSSTSFDIIIKNNGNKTINSTYVTVSASFGSLSGVNCNFDSIQPGVQKICGTFVLKSSEDGTSIVTVDAMGLYDSRELKYQATSVVEILKPPSSEKNEGKKNDEDEFKSEKLSAPKVTKQSIPKKYLTLVSYPDKITLEQGKSSTFKITVRNEDDFDDQKVSIKIIGINSTWFTLSPHESKIKFLSSFDYNLNVIIPEDAEINEYKGEIEVSSDLETKRQTFTLNVLPGEKFKKNVDSLIEEYQIRISELEKEINEKREKNYNTTEAEEKLKELKEEFNRLLTYRDAGNYKLAYSGLELTEDLIKETSSLLSGAMVMPTSFVNSPLIPLMFGLLLVVGGYTFWGRHINLKFIDKIKRKKSLTKDDKFGEIDLIKNILSGNRPEKSDLSKPKVFVTDRIAELDKIRNLVRGIKT
ncbi:MAG: CARDB domain-containing protein [Candidatus Aenigmatarchaeota archaeon]